MDDPGTDRAGAGQVVVPANPGAVDAGAALSAELAAALTTQGPLSASTATALLEYARAQLDVGEPARAAAIFRRVIGHPDATITAAAWLGLGDALYRLDAEGQAAQAWESVVKLPDTESTYRAWRAIAGARVRAGDLRGATAAYREADRRAPRDDKAEIASRLGWLAKETGNTGLAQRYFARSRGMAGPLGLTQVILLITVAISLWSMVDPAVIRVLELDPRLVKHGELYRLLSVVLVHDPTNLLHLGFNMYALYLVGPIVEGAWGARPLGFFYVLTAIAASTGSVLFSAEPAVGASGAIFGLVGVLVAGTRAHHPMLDQRARAIVPQLVPLIIINLIFGFLAGGSIDNAAHIGGLLAGLWLGIVVPPGKVPTLRSFWQQTRGAAAGTPMLLVAAGVAGLLGVISLGLALGGVRI